MKATSKDGKDIVAFGAAIGVMFRELSKWIESQEIDKGSKEMLSKTLNECGSILSSQIISVGIDELKKVNEQPSAD